MMRTSAHLFGFLWLIAAIAQISVAGTVIQQSEFEPGSPQSRQTATIFMDAGKLRVEGTNPSSGAYVLIFDGSKLVTWMIEPDKGSYMEITSAQVQQLAGQMQNVSAQMQQAMQQMQAQMANMPPEQRAMMEQMMKGRMGVMMGGGAAASAPKTVREKSRGEKVGQFTCTKYEILSGSELSQEVCAVPAGDLKLDASAMETFKALANFYEPLTRMASSFAGNWVAPSGMDQIDGFPVQTVKYSNQRATSEWRVEKIETRSIEASLFELPAGLQKNTLPQMPAGR